MQALHCLPLKCFQENQENRLWKCPVLQESCTWQQYCCAWARIRVSVTTSHFVVGWFGLPTLSASFATTKPVVFPTDLFVCHTLEIPCETYKQDAPSSHPGMYLCTFGPTFWAAQLKQQSDIVVSCHACVIVVRGDQGPHVLKREVLFLGRAL